MGKKGPESKCHKGCTWKLNWLTGTITAVSAITKLTNNLIFATAVNKGMRLWPGSYSWVVNHRTQHLMDFQRLPPSPCFCSIQICPSSAFSISNPCPPSTYIFKNKYFMTISFWFYSDSLSPQRQLKPTACWPNPDGYAGKSTAFLLSATSYIFQDFCHVHPQFPLC